MRLQRYLAAFALLVAGYVVPAHAQRYSDSIDCGSRDYGYVECDANFRNPVLVRQTSDSACVEGRSWGVTRRGRIWVNKGCSGVFAEAGRRGPGPGRGDGDWRPGAGWDQDIVLECASNDYRYNMCQVDVGRGGGVQIVRQLSDTRCIEGRNWGWNRAGVWVDQGCAARFRVERRWR